MLANARVAELIVANWHAKTVSQPSASRQADFQAAANTKTTQL